MMRDFIIEHCQKSGFNVSMDDAGNIYVIKGKADSFPCYVAHMDTVHAISGDGIALVSLGDNVTGFNPVTMRQASGGMTSVAFIVLCAVWMNCQLVSLFFSAMKKPVATEAELATCRFLPIAASLFRLIAVGMTIL